MTFRQSTPPKALTRAGASEPPVIPTPTTTGIVAPLLFPPPAPPAAPTATFPSGLGFVRTITNADDGGTVMVQAGDRFALALQAPAGFDNWEVQPVDPAILVPVPNPAAAAIRGATLRAYRAVAPGEATITAEARPHCDAGQVCLLVVRAFHVTVMVK